MTDQTIHADAIRAWRDKYRGCTGNNALEALDALIPAPSRPTLADMTPEGRAECAWMQADVEHRGRAVVIVPEWGAGHAELLNRWGSVFYASHDRVTPRPDLPRMEWPGDTPTGPNTLAVGTVIESADDPRIDALPLGTILLDRNEEATTKRPRPWGWTGLGNTPAEDEDGEPGPWTVLHIPKETDQ